MVRINDALISVFQYKTTILHDWKFVKIQSAQTHLNLDNIEGNRKGVFWLDVASLKISTQREVDGNPAA